ncbi:MAG: VWA domain-containing protein [Vicinamibacterales bacterium]
MRRLLAAWLIVAGPLDGPQQQTPPATFRSSTHLILQTVSVTDAQGRPIRGLTARDFIITEDGRRQQVAFVDYEELDTTPLAPMTFIAPVMPETVPMPAQDDTRYRGRRLLIFYFDLAGMDFFDKGRAFGGAADYINRRMTAADMIAVMAFQGRGVELRLDFTDDRAALAEMMRQLEIEAGDARLGVLGSFDSGGGAFGEDAGTFNLFSIDRQLSALQTAVTDLAPLPQAKTLIYFASGLGDAGTDNMAQLRATVNAAVRANVTLNPIDTRGLQATPPMGDASRSSPGGVGMFSGATAQGMVMRADRERDVLFAIAKDTGGRATFDSNDLGLGIADIARSIAGYYILGYYTTNTAADGRYRRVKVALANGMAADLSYRRGFYGSKDYGTFNAFDKERQLADALMFEDPITDIPMAMELHYFQISSAEYFVPISIRMPASEIAQLQPKGSTRAILDMIGEIKDEHGVTMRNSRDKLEFTLEPDGASGVRRPIQYETGFSLLPGSYVIKVLARDATTGRIGTFLRPFSIPNLVREQVRLPTSTVMLTQQRVASTDALFTVKQKIPVEVANPLFHQGQRLVASVTRTFSQGRPLYVFLHAYPAPSPKATAGRAASAMRPIAAFVAFYRDGVKIFETDPVGVTEGDPKLEALPIRLTVPLASLEPGGYECQVTVLDPAGERAAFWRAAMVIVR